MSRSIPAVSAVPAVAPPCVVHDTSGEGLAPELLDLIAQATAHDGHAPFGEHVLLTLDGQRHVTHAKIESRLEDRLAGYLLLCEGLDRAWSADVVTRPDCRNRGVGTGLLRAAAEHVAGHGGGQLRAWAYSSGAPDTIATRLGMQQCRAVSYQTRPLHDVPTVTAPTGTVLRCLQPEEVDAWLHLSNNAFLGHPENGNWTREDLTWRLAASWTDLRRFVVLADARTDELLGGVWTKIEPQSTEGELYVVAIRPDKAGQGLGSILVNKTLAVLARAGQTTASLYVDTANTAANALYAKTGFTPQHTDRCFQLTVASGSTAITV